MRRPQRRTLLRAPGRAGRTAALLAAASILLASCASLTSSPTPMSGMTSGAPMTGTPQSSPIPVDGPQLAALRSQAGLDPCVAGKGAPVSGGLPSITLPCLGGGTSVDLSSLRGPTVISLFASWCTYCAGEIPYFQQLKKEYAGRLTVMAIDYEDPSPFGALTMLKQQGAHYAALADPGGQLRVPLRVRGLPGLILLHRDGTYTVGYFVLQDYASLKQRVVSELGSEL